MCSGKAMRNFEKYWNNVTLLMNNVMITPLPPTLWLINNVWDSSFKALLMKGVGSIQRNLLHPFFCKARYCNSTGTKPVKIIRFI